MRRIATKFACLLLALALMLVQAAPAFAVINGTDYVGTTSVTDRNLTITEAPTVECECGILVNSDGTVLWSRNADMQHAMASITKTMTAVVALENGDPDDVFTISEQAASIGESSAGLFAGAHISLYDLLCGLLVHSGNDAAYAIAEGIAGSEASFVQMMNEKAQQMGLQNTHFTNPHGLDEDGHYSTVSDISVICRYAMNNETFRQIVGMKEVTLDYGDGEERTFHSTNSLVNTWDECEGIKTGFTDAAGYALASAAMRDGVELFAVVLGCSTESERFTDSYRLLDWGFNHYRALDLAAAGEPLVNASHSGYLNSTVAAGVDSDVWGMVMDYDGDVSVDVDLQDISGSVHVGDRLGTITWRQGEHVIASAPLVALERKWKPWAVYTIWASINRLIGWFTGDDCVADTEVLIDVIEVSRFDDLTGEQIDQDLEEEIISDALEYK